MSIATKVEGAGWRICETGSPVCTGINPCFGCWVKVNTSTLPPCVRQMIPDPNEVRTRLKPIMDTWQASCLRMTDLESNAHPQAFRDMQETALDASGEQRSDPLVRSQPYWVILLNQVIMTERHQRRALEAAMIEPDGAMRAAENVEVRPGKGKPQRGEVAAFVKEASEKAAASSSEGIGPQVLGRVAFPRRNRGVPPLESESEPDDANGAAKEPETLGGDRS